MTSVTDGKQRRSRYLLYVNESGRIVPSSISTDDLSALLTRFKGIGTADASKEKTLICMDSTGDLYPSNVSEEQIHKLETEVDSNRIVTACVEPTYSRCEIDQLFISTQTNLAPTALGPIAKSMPPPDYILATNHEGFVVPSPLTIDWIHSLHKRVMHLEDLLQARPHASACPKNGAALSD